MTKSIPFTLFTLGILLSSSQALAHGAPMSEKDRKASEGVFENTDVKDRALTDWDGVWQSINPYLLNGDLDPVLQKKAKENKSKSVEEYREYYKKGYATDIDMIGIEKNVIEFHQNSQVRSCYYHYDGFKILTYSSGKKGVRYLFECRDKQSTAPKYVQFSDHIIGPKKSSHYHFYMGNDSQEALLKEMDHWPTYYEYSLSKEQLVHEMLEH